MLAKNRNHNPNLRPGSLYALQQIVGGKYVVNIHSNTPEEIHSSDPRKARRYSGEYLNGCAWGWSLDYDSIPVKDLDKRIASFKALKPTGPKAEPVKPQTKNTKRK